MNIDAVIELIRNVEREIAAARQRVVDGIDLSSPTDIVGGMLIAEALDYLDTLVRQVIDWLEEISIAFGNPADIDRAANGWASGVGGPVSELRTLVESSDLLRGGNWTGEAAEAYGRLIPIQLDAIGDVIDPIALEIYDALSDAWLGVSVFQMGLVATLVALIAGIATSFTIAPLIAAVATAAVALTTAVITLQWELRNAAGTLGTLDAGVRDSWPQFAR
ncbi:hypothetical protein Bcav_0407 [Beutenbergia cavernae DSM 12333]|uniref:Uncharacterized protein n=1 Tax=Beutenbergia cavernae (strain ATCC BAA-8 / DSM 12333 / CCUG 43141 / JCM 11478 / NBRC 16432 / NCIMB 13614 / HKI 0122) TaxID=471853 RepID=C5BWZ6_BEUC1|nr:hypothetical protein [Beutenbergia cavernae]ACQ78671.1 hypothetical protein Bcav_0407 [Beutenbergia cavernae DSM 12333]